MTRDDLVGPDGDLKRNAVQHTVAVTTELVPGRHGLKVGRYGRHVGYSDEHPNYGGNDEYPPPLVFAAWALGWCLLSQVTRYASILKIPIQDATCSVEMDWVLDGSVLRGDVRSSCKGVRSNVFIDSSEASPAQVRRLIQLAERGCFLSQLVSTAVPLDTRVCLNGESVPLVEEGGPPPVGPPRGSRPPR